MKVEQVFQLLEKGFTRDDIMKLTETTDGTETESEQPAQQEQPEPQEQQEPKEQPAPQEQPDEHDQTGQRLDSIEQSIEKLVKAIQLQNLKTDSFGKAGETLEEQTDKIMASIIRPEP